MWLLVAESVSATACCERHRPAINRWKIESKWCMKRRLVRLCGRRRRCKLYLLAERFRESLSTSGMFGGFVVVADVWERFSEANRKSDVRTANGNGRA